MDYHPCTAYQEVATKCLTALAMSGACVSQLFPVAQDPAEMIEAIMKITAPKTYEVEHCADGCCEPDTEDVFDTFRHQVQILKKMTKGIFHGLCLDYFKAGGSFGGTCRFKHRK